MLRRHLMGYLPSSLVPAVASVLSIYIFTRLLDPHAFGMWSLANNITLLGQTVFFIWVQVATSRFLPQAREEGRGEALTGVVAIGLGASMALAAVLYAVTLPLLGLTPDLSHVMWLALPMLLARAVTGVALVEYRADMRILRYNLTECGQTLLGLLAGVALAVLWDGRAESIVLGTLIGAAIVGAPYGWTTLRRLRHARIDGPVMRAFLAYGLPLTLNNALAYLLSASDRVLIEYFLNSAAVGVYSVSYALVERGLTTVFLVVTLAAFPLAIRAYDERGAAGAEAQMRETGAILMGLAVPAVVGLVLANRQLIAFLVGPEFRAAATEITPWVTLTALFSGLTVHFFNHAFLLTNNTKRLLWLQIPPALLTVGLNLLLLPRIGLMGAVVAGVSANGLAFLLSVLFGRRHLRIPLPIGPALRALAASLPMAVLFLAVEFPENGTGFLMMVVAGVLLYGPAALALNVAGVREIVQRRRGAR